MTLDQWERSPFCCICGSRSIAKQGPEQLRQALTRHSYWLMEIYPTVDISKSWNVYQFCSRSCFDMFQINPLAYEDRVSYTV